MPRTVVLIDDHQTFTELLEFAIGSDPDLTCVGIACALAGGLRLVVERQPDVVVMDYQFDDDDADDGLTATAAITSRFPDIRVVLLTGHADSGLLARAVEARASGVLSKNGSLPDLLNAVKDVGAGGMLVDPVLVQTDRSSSRSLGGAVKPLSPREQDVLSMLVLGMRTDAISQELGISRHTSRGYVKAILWKLGAHSQLEAVAIARRRGLVPRR